MLHFLKALNKSVHFVHNIHKEKMVNRELMCMVLGKNENMLQFEVTSGKITASCGDMETLEYAPPNISFSFSFQNRA